MIPRKVVSRLLGMLLPLGCLALLRLILRMSCGYSRAPEEGEHGTIPRKFPMAKENQGPSLKELPQKGHLTGENNI
jgi:hypothetical protein